MNTGRAIHNDTRGAVARLVNAALIGIVPFGAFAEEEPASPHTFSANVTLASEYIYRGVTQTNEDPALQGGFDYSHSSGFYMGTWASNLEYNAGTADASSIEIDLYGGFSGSFANGIGWDVGALYYAYPEQDEDDGAGDFDFVEAYGSFSYEWGELSYAPSIEVGVAWSPDFFGETGDAVYTHGTFGLSLPYDFSPYVTIANQWIDDAESYWHYAVGVSKEIGMFTFDLGWQDANDLGGCGDACEAVVFSISSSW